MTNARRLESAAVVTLAFLIAACGGSDVEGDRVEGAAPARTATGTQVLRKDPGETGKPGTIWQSKGRTKAYLRRLQFNEDPAETHTVSIDCHPTTGSGHPQSVELLLQPEERVLAFDFPRDKQWNHGRFVAKVTNVGSGHCELFQLDRGASVYWWIGKNVLHQDQVRFIKVDASSGESTEVATAEYAAGPPWDSTPGHEKPATAHARWNQAGLLASLGATPTTHETAWISCELGCCVAGGIRSLR